MNPKFKPYNQVRIGQVVMSITCIDKFGVTDHYGLSWTEDGTSYLSGWIPCVVLDGIGTPVIFRDDMKG